MPKTIIESCVSSLSESIAAENNGADRLELCSRLDLDGLTPPPQLVEAVLNSVNIPVKVMIRPREGDFTYSPEEKNQIRKDIDQCKALHVRHYVYGSILDGRLDLTDLIEVYNYIVDDNYPIESFTIHKAIDTSSDPLGDMELLLEHFPLNGEHLLSVLSSGTADTALNGAAFLNEMITLAENNIEIIVAGKVTTSNLLHVMDQIPSKAYHGRRIVALT